MLLGPQICVTAHKPGFEPAVQLLTVTERDHGETLLLRIVMARSTGRLRIDCVVMDVEGHVMPEATVTISKPPPAAGRVGRSGIRGSVITLLRIASRAMRPEDERGSA